jgi:CO/xanthine dehydrogenase Mo-binding subunit
MAKFGIGQAMTRREDQRLLFGTGQYVDDVAVPNEDFVAFVRTRVSSRSTRNRRKRCPAWWLC